MSRRKDHRHSAMKRPAAAAAQGLSFTVKGHGAPVRLDRALALRFPEHGRRELAACIAQRKVAVNGQVVWLGSWQVIDGDTVTLLAPLPEPRPAAPTFSDSWVLAWGDDWLAVNKPAGVLSHATRAHDGNDLQTMARLRYGPLSVAHRLDRDTSGVTLLAAAGPFSRYLDRVFKEGLLQRIYLALAEERTPLTESFTITARLAPDPARSDRMIVAARGGQRAETRVRLLGRADGAALLRCELLTGRTHQIRAHLAHAGAPVAGDRYYNEGGRLFPRLMLHAARLILPALDEYPQTNLYAPPPPEFLAALPEALRKAAKREGQG